MIGKPDESALSTSRLPTASDSPKRGIIYSSGVRRSAMCSASSSLARVVFPAAGRPTMTYKVATRDRESLPIHPGRSTCRDAGPEHMGRSNVPQRLIGFRRARETVSAGGNVCGARAGRVPAVGRASSPIGGREEGWGGSPSWYFSAMRTTMDAAGRLVVPKALRDALGLYGGEELDARARDGRLEIEPVLTPMHLERHGNGLVAVPEVDLPVLTGEQVRETLEQTRS